MARYIKAVECADIISKKLNIPLGDLVDVFAEVPTADVVEVVRCRDCKWLYDEMDDYCCRSHRGLARICENSFCSYGERRANDQT